MKAVWLRSRADLRARRWGWLALAVMLGVFGGAVVAVAAGARRTESAYPRMLAASNAMDAIVFDFAYTGSATDLDAVAELPEVSDWQRYDGFTGFADDLAHGSDFVSVVAGSGRLSRPKVLRGRLPEPSAIDEVAMSRFNLDRFGAELGATITVNFVDASSPVDEPVAVPVQLRVVGVTVAPNDFPTAGDGDGGALNVVSGAFVSANADRYVRSQALGVALAHGAADYPRFETDTEGLSDGPAFVSSTAAQALKIERSFQFLADALWILAALGGLTVLLVGSQLVARQILLESDDFPALRAMGMTRAQLLGVVLVRTAAVALVAAAVATAVAFAGSAFMPIGSARIAEPHPGLAFDATAIGVGGGLIVVLTVLISAVPGRRAARRAGSSTRRMLSDRRTRASRLTSWLARASAPPTMVTGVRLATEPGHGRTAVPVRTTLAGVVIGLTALTAAVTFGASVDHLTSTPRLYGVAWDAEIDSPSLGDNRALDDIVPALSTMPGVDALSVGGTAVPVHVDDVAADAIAMDVVRGSVLPPASEGRQPSAPDEIALGGKTLDALHKHVGDSVVLDVDGLGSAEVRIVGQVVLPPVGDNGVFGEGAILPYQALLRAVPDGPPPNAVLVRFSSDAARRDGLAALRADLPYVQVYQPGTPIDIVDFGRVRSIPMLLAGLLGLLAAATLVHALVTAVRRRRRDLAVLKALGFVDGQIRRTVRWQAASVAIIALVIALPVGITLGRSLWDVAASELGIVAEPVTPVGLLSLLAPMVLVLAVAVAAAPARLASRTVTAQVLRIE